MTEQPQTALDDGGRAFPIAWEETNQHGVRYPMVFDGMSLRDAMAIGALQGVIASEGESMTPAKVAARRAYEYADAMLAVRKGGSADV